MKKQPSLISRAWRKLFPGKPKPPEPVRLAPVDGKPSEKPKAPARSSIEPLEGRIAPAALLPGGKVLKYTDADGDAVTITFSKAIFGNLNTTLDSVFTFSTGDAHSDSSTPQQLQLIDLTKIPLVNGKNPAAGVSFTVTATQASGDGLANIGAINATNLALGSVAIDGDLGHIDCGASGSVIGLKSLSVASLGVQTNTQAGATPDFTSQIVGELGSFHAGTVVGAYLHVVNGQSTFGLPAAAVGKIGSIDIDHSLQARTIPAGTGTAPVNDGVIQSAANIGSVKVGIGNLTTDGLLGGWGVASGSIVAGGKISSVTIEGNIAGGVGSTSGAITASDNISTIVIDGNIVGGAGVTSGSINEKGHIDSVTVHGGITGGAGTTSGSINAAGSVVSSVTFLNHSSTKTAPSGSLGSFSMTGDITGGAGATSGSINLNADLTSFVMHGDLVGGGGATSGSINLSGSTTINVPNLGTKTSNTADIVALEITGAITGGPGKTSGSINTNSDIRSATLHGDLAGGDGPSSGSINAQGNLDTIKILGNAAGGNGGQSGLIHADGNIRSVLVGTTAHSGLTGGSGDGSGVISSGGTMGKVTIVGDIQGGSPDVAGGIPVVGSTGTYAGGISATGKLSSVSISGSIKGGGGIGSGFVEGLSTVGSIKVTDSVVGGMGPSSGSITSAGDLASLTVGISLTGGAGQDSGSVFAAVSGTGNLIAATIGSSPAGSAPVAHGLIAGAGRTSGSIGSGDAIGAVTITGVKIGTSNVAMQGGAQDFSASIFAEGAIRSVKITGDMVGDAGDHSASIEAHGLLGSLVLNGNASGGAGTASASVSSLDTSDFTLSGNIGTITAGNFVGGTGANSGQIRADGTITSIHLGTLEKSGASGAGALLSGMGTVGDGSVGTVTIANLNSTIAIGGRLGALTAESITGSKINVADDLGALTVHGDVADSTFTARGQAVQGASKDLAFGKIAISKGVSNSNFLAGYDLNGLPVNGDAQIGAVTVGKDWVASSLVAGVQAGDDKIFGTADDSAIGAGSPGIVSKIASVVIGGAVSGTTATGDGFGFVAEAIGTFRVGKTPVVLMNGVADLGTTDDVEVREVATV